MVDHRTNQARLVAPLACVALLLATGCGKADTGQPGPSHPATTTPTAPASSPASPSPSASRSSGPAGSPADGTNLSACADADCEVLIRGTAVLPLDPRFDAGRFVLTYVPPDTVRCESDGSYTSTSGGHAVLTVNGITVVVERYTKKGAIVRITPPK